MPERSEKTVALFKEGCACWQAVIVEEVFP
ncbi:MAG: hypothetical protein BWX70_02086 [Verrucomicrobia bacterium ADurb.Bin070]|jgi:hypothetical protein|nr:MAG: hypothetical protein BWX70_02086 [Verrucomicrobia bacterium ADurb.Bin070]